MENGKRERDWGADCSSQSLTANPTDLHGSVKVISVNGLLMEMWEGRIKGK